MAIVRIDDAKKDVQCLDENHTHLVYDEDDLGYVTGVLLYCVECHCRWEITA